MSRGASTPGVVPEDRFSDDGPLTTGGHTPWAGIGKSSQQETCADLLAFLSQRLGDLARVIPHYKAGTLGLLAQSTAQRSPELGEIPTFRELGFEALVLLRNI